jgi:hypothetical protein
MLQKISSKNCFIWKNEKDLKKTHDPFIKESHSLLWMYLHPLECKSPKQKQKNTWTSRFIMVIFTN